MRALRKIFRPRWLALLVMVTAAASAAAFVSTSAVSASAPPASNPAHPVVDANWIYQQDFYDATHFIYKRAGSDGCLQGATTCGSGGGTPGDSNNLPMNYNGTQEFNEWWAALGVTHDTQQNGPLGRFMNRRNHLFNQASWQINVQELTIPGATCAGQQVMLAYHPDSQGVSAPNITTSSTPLSGMYSGSWGTGSAYDSNMGALMNLEEIGAVLRWHHANGTYPARTIHSAVFDAELQNLAGSGDYSATGTAATLLAGSTSVGDTNIKVASTTNINTVGTTIALDEINTENPTVASVGTASTATTIVAPTAVGATKVYVASITNLLTGHTIDLDAGQANQEQATIQTVGTAQRTATTLSAASAVGDTNIKVASVTNMVVGEGISVDAAPNIEYGTISTVGTAGAAGTGVTLTAPLTIAHASGAAARDLGSGLTLTAGLTKTHASGAGLLDASTGTGITLTAPLTKAHQFGSTVNGSATGLLSDSPQGQVVGVLNNDQDGINYPALHWGTDHYLNDLVNGGVGPWFNNINATPVSPAANSIYGTVGIQRLQHNLPAVQAFRANVESAVTRAIADLGAKYNYSMPIGNPDLYKNTGSVPDNPLPSTLPSYLPQDQARYTPVQDDRTGRTDQVSFGVRGIPSLGDIGVYDGNTDPLVGGNENPYPSSYPSKPNILFLYGQDTMSDYFSNLNFFAGGQVHGPAGYDKPSEGLLRGIEFIATFFSYAVASDSLGGKVTAPDRPIAYFDQTPRKATAQTTVTYDAGFSRTKDGLTSSLTYYWDFGDGTPLQMTTNPIIQHTFPTQAAWRDVKLLVGNGGKWGAFRQVEPIDFFPTYYPAVAPATEPLPPSTGPSSDPCGTLSPTELSSMIEAAKTAKHAPPTNVALNDLASIALKTNADN